MHGHLEFWTGVRGIVNGARKRIARLLPAGAADAKLHSMAFQGSFAQPSMQSTTPPTWHATLLQLMVAPVLPSAQVHLSIGACSVAGLL
jgi:hypothetical protein